MQSVTAFVLCQALFQSQLILLLVVLKINPEQSAHTHVEPDLQSIRGAHTAGWLAEANIIIDRFVEVAVFLFSLLSPGNTTSFMVLSWIWTKWPLFQTQIKILLYVHDLPGWSSWVANLIHCREDLAWPERTVLTATLLSPDPPFSAWNLQRTLTLIKPIWVTFFSLFYFAHFWSCVTDRW